MPRSVLMAAIVTLTACGKAEPVVEPQPLDLPADPAAEGVPVGVRTVLANDESFEVWYPADEDTTGDDDVISLLTYVPDEVATLLAEVTIPTWTQHAIRDAAPRPVDAPLPVVVFSHGVSGFRTQSAALCAHLASRGYVVISVDHPGRDLATFAPCLFTPPAGECQLGGMFGDDPAPPQIDHMLAWLDAGVDWLDGLADTGNMGIFGHSAGGFTTTTVTNANPRFLAALPLAGGGDFTGDAKTAIIGGSCDGVVGESQLVPSAPTTTDGYWSLAGAGHLAFSDLCKVDMGAVGTQLSTRPDANALFIQQLSTLGTDGCPSYTPTASDTCSSEAFLDLDTSDQVLNYAVTAFFDQKLKQSGPGLEAGAYAQLTKAP